jgi:adenylate cyclase
MGVAIMAEKGFKRKLTAILSADVVGYSRLMRDDEEATVLDLAAHRVLITEIIQHHHGWVVDSPGDNILAEFASVVDAVNGAIKIQEDIKNSNKGIPEDRRMEFRIGINLGDVIEEEERIYGDGVNIAARVEGLAVGGGIAISVTVYEHIKDKLSLGYHYLGEQDVKNISEPVRVYRLLTEPSDAGKMISEEKPKASKLRLTTISALAFIILVAGAFVTWNYYFRVQIEPASLENMAYSLPDKPSIAVLPFDNMSEDPKQEFFSDGMTEEIITALSKVPYLLVIARNSTFSYKGKPVKIRLVAEELAVRYVLEGSFRKAGDRVRVTAQLIDAIKGHHLWAERYERKLKDIFALQDEITMKILRALEVKLTEGEQASPRRKGTEDIEVYLKTLQAMEYSGRGNKDGNLVARQMAEEAMALDPEYARPYRILAVTHVMDIFYGTSKSPKSSMEGALKLAQKAISLDDSDPCGYETLSFIYFIKRQHDRAIAEAARAIALAPNGADAKYRLGQALIYASRPEEAIASLEKAIRINPIAPATYFLNLGRAYRDTGRYEEAIREFRKAINRTPDNYFAHLGLAASYSLAGRDEEARSEVAEVLRIVPKTSLKGFAKALPYKNKADTDRIIVAMRKAGLPE